MTAKLSRIGADPLKWPTYLVLPLVLLSSIPAWAGELPRLESRIESIDLFKNGFAAVHRTVEPPAAGTYRIEDIPRPVHGTFWIGGENPIVARMTMAEVEVPLTAAELADMQAALAGREVTVHFHDEIPPVSGTVVPRTREHVKPQWEHAPGTETHARWTIAGLARPQPQRPFLILRTAEGHAYVDPARIAHLLVQDERETIVQRKPVMLLTVEGDDQVPEPISISYLTYGFAWAPSYRVDLRDGMLTLEQQAVLKNEMGDFEEAELRLISGYPNIQFAHVTSPLSLESTWTAFIRQLNQRPAARGADASYVVVQTVIPSRSGEPELALPIEPQGMGVDLHYESIGRWSMNEGDALKLTVARGHTQYERIVEWIVPDTRDASGRHITDRQRLQEPEQYDDVAWNAVRFRNPLPLPMTTAPATITENGRFAGQRMSPWVNVSQPTTLHITQALSVHTRAMEEEVAEEDRQIVYVGGRRYRQVNVEGTLEIGNLRNEPIQLVIRRRFSGELTEADGDPAVALLEEGVYFANRRNELTWTQALDAGEERTLRYRYAVLVAY